jgi:sugar-phosphatase
VTTIISAEFLLLDLDGTLVDTTAAVDASWRAVAEQLDLPFTAFAPHIHGVPADQVLALAAPAVSRNDRARLAAHVLSRQADPALPVTPLPGALALLTTVPADRWAIVTSGNLELAHSTITKAGLPWPELLITADDVTHGKPDPEPYLQAARRARVQPQRCLVIEDSIAGVTAGRAAAAPVLALTTTHTASELTAASWVISDLSAVHTRVHAGNVELQTIDPAVLSS